MSPPVPEVVGVVLAGGQSRRMGFDKTRLQFAGSSLAELAVQRLQSITRDVLVADRGLEKIPGTSSIADGPGAGPVAGILGASIARPGCDLLVLACDLPEVPETLLRYLARPTQGDAHVPRWSRGPEPLCALYRASAFPKMELEVRQGHLALHKMLRHCLRVSYLEGDLLTSFGAPEQVFSNLNTPQDLVALDERSSSS